MTYLKFLLEYYLIKLTYAEKGERNQLKNIYILKVIFLDYYLMTLTYIGEVKRHLVKIFYLSKVHFHNSIILTLWKKYTKSSLLI